MAQTLPGAMDWWSRMRGDQAVVVLDGDVLTYAQYKGWSDRVAAMLIADGLIPGERVGVCSANSLAYVALIMGIIRAGGILCPINFRYKPREVGELIESTEPRFVFASTEHSPQVEQSGTSPRQMREIEALRTGDPVLVTHDPEPDAPVVIISTSGSTAKPKGVIFTNRSVTSYAANWAVEETSSSAGSRVITLAPLNTSAGFVQLMHYSVQGCTLYMMPQFDPLEALRMIERERITCFGAVPAFFEFIANLPEFPDADLTSIKLATAGGARVSQKLLKAYKSKGVTIRQIYGQTEVGGNATMMPEHLALSEPEKCGWGSVFMDLRVVRPDGSDCDPGEPGEIIMRSPAMMQGYWRNPEETAKTIRGGWLYSGDIGALDDRGLLSFVDRMKDLIISGGLNISAAEVENVIGDFEGVIEVLVIAAPDDKFGETPLAVIHASEEIDVPALMVHCEAYLSNYKLPRYVTFSNGPLPRLATGKLSKPAVREAYASAHETLPPLR
jgi:fatty-acyl-CoA synthase